MNGGLDGSGSDTVWVDQVSFNGNGTVFVFEVIKLLSSFFYIN